MILRAKQKLPLSRLGNGLERAIGNIFCNLSLIFNRGTIEPETNYGRKGCWLLHKTTECVAVRQERRSGQPEC
jgi:hypothetical protein